MLIFKKFDRETSILRFFIYASVLSLLTLELYHRDNERIKGVNKVLFI